MKLENNQMSAEITAEMCSRMIYLTEKEAVEFYGCKDYHNLEYMLRKKHIPFIRIGRKATRIAVWASEYLDYCKSKGVTYPADREQDAQEVNEEDLI